MIDIIDLMNEIYDAQLDPITDKCYELSFVNKANDHDVYMNIMPKEIILLADNLERILDVLREIEHD